MGYYVSITDSTFTIAPENLDEAFRRLCALNDDDNLKTGGRYGPPTNCNKNDPRPAGAEFHPARWFSWMDANYPTKCETACDVLMMLGFECEFLDDGSLIIVSYDNKTGQEQLFLETLSNLATGYIAWQGEDSSEWKDEYGDIKVVHFFGHTVWEQQ